MTGWVAAQWNSAVRARFQSLLAALAERFDGRLFAVNLPETSVDLDTRRDNAGFTCDTNFKVEMDNLVAVGRAFQRTRVVQYVNFLPCEWENDRNYMRRLFAFAAKNDVGLGDPNVVSGRKGQMKNSNPFFKRYKGQLAVIGMAVQEPTLTYENPKTASPLRRMNWRHSPSNTWEWTSCSGARGRPGCDTPESRSAIGTAAVGRVRRSGCKRLLLWF